MKLFAALYFYFIVGGGKSAKISLAKMDRGYSDLFNSVKIKFICY